MHEISFSNKVWVSRRRRKVYTWLITLCCLYLLFNTIVIIMEGISLYSGFTTFAAVVIILWALYQKNNDGQYIEVDCRIAFSRDKIIWEYPSITLQPNKPDSHVIYKIEPESIINISVSRELGSMRVECAPLAECTYKGKEETVDYRKSKKPCVLITYNYNIDELMDLFRKYTGKEITVIV